MDNNMADFSPDSSSQEDFSQQSSDSSLPSIADLEKMEKFRFEGQEWTPKDLKNAYLRQQDYTKKTQTLAEERKAFETERKYYENLHADLAIVRSNPSLANEFFKVYPQKFHGAVKQILNESGVSQSQQPQQRQGPDPDTLSRLAHLEKFYDDQEVSKNEQEINSTIERLSTKYADAIPEMVIGRVFEAYQKILQNDPQAKLTSQMWEDTFKSVDQYMKDLVNTKYRSKQQEQMKANKRSGDVSAGGGTVGRAPQKFSGPKAFKDITEHAVRDLTGRS